MKSPVHLDDARAASQRSARPRRALTGAAFVAVLVVASLVRLAPWESVFTPFGVRFAVDTDPHYHVLRAQRAVSEWPRVDPHDPWLDYPNGVDVIWPPLFDEVIAGASVAIGGRGAAPELVERVASVVPVVLGVLTVAITALLGAAFLGGGPWLDAALLLALLPLHGRFSIVGRPDQHVAEVLLFGCVVLAFVRGWTGARRWAWRVLLGLVLCLSFWTWHGSALNLVFLCAAIVGWHVCAPRSETSAEDLASTACWGSAAAAVAVAVSIAAFGPPGALSRFSLSGLTAFPVVLCAVAAALSGAVLWARRAWPLDSPILRLAQVASLGLVCAAPFAFPLVRAPVLHGLLALLRGGPWYGTISEFSPMFGQYGWAEELPYRFAQFGFAPLLVPVGLYFVARRWRRDPSQRPALFVFTGALLSFGAFSVLRVRFGVYLAPLLAIAAAVAVRGLVHRVSARFGLRPFLSSALVTAGVLVVAAPTPAHLRDGLSPEGLGTDEVLIATLKRLGALDPADPSRPAVFARWPLGHLIRYYAHKPVVTNGFGIEGGERSLDDWAAFAFATDPDGAERVLERRRIGFLVVGELGEVALLDFPYAPVGSPPVVTRSTAGQLQPLPGLADLAISRIALLDGSERPGRDEQALGHLRLLLESPPGSVTSALKVFGWVPGCMATLATGNPGAIVNVAVELTTDLGRRERWSSTALADDGGMARALLPYSTGINGYVQASPYVVTVGSRRTSFAVSEPCVRAGDSFTLDLASGSAR